MFYSVFNLNLDYFLIKKENIMSDKGRTDGLAKQFEYITFSKLQCCWLKFEINLSMFTQL